MKTGTVKTKKGKYTFSKTSLGEKIAKERQAKRDYNIKKLELKNQLKATNKKAETVRAIGSSIAKNIGSAGRAASGVAVSSGIVNGMPNTSGYTEVLDPVIKEDAKESNDSTLLVP